MSTNEFLQLAALRLTAAHDGEGLANAYLELVRDIALARHVDLLEVHTSIDVHTGTRLDGPEHVQFHRVDTGQAVPVRKTFDDRGVYECIENRSPVSINACGGRGARVVLPVSGSHNPQRLVIIDDPAPTPTRRIALLQLTELFGNQSKLIDDRERDPLTALLNRQALNQRFLRMTASEAEEPLWLAVIDIDQFKNVNDRYGHLLGDEVLLHMARLLESTFRYTDAVFRFGGEEFVVLLRAEAAAAAAVLERLRAAVAEHQFPRVGRVTISIGYTQVMPGQMVPTVIDTADRALYEAKHGGRNCVVLSATNSTVLADGEVEMF